MLLFQKKLNFFLCVLLVVAIFIISCSTKPDIIIRLNNDGFLLVYVPLCDELNATMEFPYAFHKSGYKEEIKCKSGDSYSINVYRTKWTGIYKEAEYAVAVNGQHFNIKASDPKPEVTGRMVAFLLSEDNSPLPFASLPRKGKIKSNVKYSYNDEGRRQVSSYELECEGRKYIIEYNNYRYNDIGMLKSFSIHLSSYKQ